MLKVAAQRSAQLELGTGSVTQWLPLLSAAEPWHEEGSSKSPGVETKNSRLRAALAVLADVPMEDWEALAQERQAGTSTTSSGEAPEAGAGASAEGGSGTQQEGSGSGCSHSPETAQRRGAAASAAASEAGEGQDAGSVAASQRGHCTAVPHPRSEEDVENVSEEGPASPPLPMPEAAGGIVQIGAPTLDAAGGSTGRRSPANGGPSSVAGGSSECDSG